MDDQEKTLLSQSGWEKLQEELKELKSVKRKEIADRLKAAKELGDISENSEYEEAKNAQAFLEGRISEIENLLRQAEVVDGDGGEAGEVNIGSKVRIRDLESDQCFQYVVVGARESNPSEQKISYQSPVGAALFGQTEGETVSVDLPVGTVEYKIMSVE